MRLPRPLPLLALLIGLGLAAKIGLLGDLLADLAHEPPLIAEAAASGGGEPAPAAEAEAGGGKARPRKTCEPAPSPPPPPPTFSEAEMQVLQQLAARRDALAAREADFDRRNALLLAAEGRIDEKVAALKELQTVLDGLIRRHDAEQDAKLKSLVKIYETMKPKDAARIFEELDLDTLLPVAERMNERKLAAVMAELNPAKAKDVTVELKRLRELSAERKS